MKRTDSIYHSTLDLKDAATVELTAQERMMICEALSKCAPKESDIMPIALCMDKIIKAAN